MCPLCSGDSIEVFSAKGFPVHDCISCGHRFANFDVNREKLREIYSDEYFVGGGAGYSDYLTDCELLRMRGKYYAHLLNNFMSKGTLLDVGAAAGCILLGFRDEGWKGVGVEINPGMAKYGRENFGLEIKTGFFEELDFDSNFNLITMIQVVAHFRNPLGAFNKAHELLVDKGFLLIETWNFKSLTARIFGRHWHEYSPPSVLHWFSPETLERSLFKVGFRMIAKGRPIKKISGRHAKSLLKYRLGEKAHLLVKWIPDRITFRYFAEDLFWALFQKQ
jgi:SAM-dependent methyltransferase